MSASVEEEEEARILVEEAASSAARIFLFSVRSKVRAVENGKVVVNVDEKDDTDTTIVVASISNTSAGNCICMSATIIV